MGGFFLGMVGLQPVDVSLNFERWLSISNLSIVPPPHPTYLEAKEEKKRKEREKMAKIKVCRVRVLLLLVVVVPGHSDMTWAVKIFS